MDDSSKKYNSIKKCDIHKNSNKIPHYSNLNNFKSNKYFTINIDKNSMKRALTKYRQNNINVINNSNKTHQSNMSSTDYSQIYQTKTKLHKNASFKLDKKLLEYAEPRTKIKEFHKIQPKIIDSFIIDIENLDSFFNEENIENNENKYDINNNKKKINKNINNKQNNNILNKANKNIIQNKKDSKCKKNNKNKKESVLINLNNIEFNNNFNTIIHNENIDLSTEKIKKGYNISNTITYKNNSKKKTKQNKESEFFLNDIKDKNEILQNLNIKDFNFYYLLMMEKLYNELIKDIEINQMGMYQNKLSIIKYFLFIFNSDCNTNLYNKIDDMILKENNSKFANNTFNKNKPSSSKSKNINIFLIIKEFFIFQIVFFYMIILLALIKKENNSFQSGLYNLSFYFHQNIIVFIYIICSNFNINYNDKYNEKIYKKCLNILNENKTWLDKNNYKKYLQTNNKLSKQIIINILNQIKLYFKENPSKENDNKYLETIIDSFKSYLNTIPKRKIIALLKNINDSAPINQLLETIKLNKMESHCSEENIKKIKKNLETEIVEKKNTDSSIESFPKPPFLKPISPKYKYTLVLDLDETLVHYISDSDSAYIQIRPGAEEFIKELSEYCEIVIFTAALKSYADLVVDGIDPDGVIADRLYRQHTIGIGNANIKDLEKLGRDIKHVIIIDNYLDNFSLQPKNGLNILDFEGNEYDDELNYLKNDLIKLFKLNPDDVRSYLKDIQIDMDKRAIYFQNLNNQNNYEN